MHYYFPVLFLVPDFEAKEIECPPFRIVKRRWETSIFDLATLATKHKLHLPYQVMDVFLSQCNLEFCVMEQKSLKAAVAVFETFRLGLYAEGITPFLSPFITTHSINEYSGINSRDSEYLRDRMYPGMEEGLKTEEATMEAWPFEMSLQCVLIKDSMSLSQERVLTAGSKSEIWRGLISKTKELQLVEDIANTAPKLISLDQSLLHVWTGLEALFPGVGTELSFKIALYLAQLISPNAQRKIIYEQARASYGLRSAVAHGSTRHISIDDWQDTWSLFMMAVKAIIIRGKMPSEKDLIAELLS